LVKGSGRRRIRSVSAIAGKRQRFTEDKAAVGGGEARLSEKFTFLRSKSTIAVASPD
jgi:hypothetical protein